MRRLLVMVFAAAICASALSVPLTGKVAASDNYAHQFGASVPGQAAMFGNIQAVFSGTTPQGVNSWVTSWTTWTPHLYVKSFGSEPSYGRSYFEAAWVANVECNWGTQTSALWDQSWLYHYNNGSWGWSPHAWMGNNTCNYSAHIIY